MISNIFNEAKIDEKFKLKFSAVLEDQQKVWIKFYGTFVNLNLGLNEQQSETRTKDICHFKFILIKFKF